MTQVEERSKSTFTVRIHGLARTATIKVSCIDQGINVGALYVKAEAQTSLQGRELQLTIIHTEYTEYNNNIHNDKNA